MREWCNQLMTDFKGTSEDMAAMRARLGINDPMYDLALCELSHYKDENKKFKQVLIDMEMDNAALGALILSYEEKIDKLILKNKKLKEIVDHFISSSNSLSVHVRSEIFDKVTDTILEFKLWKLYEYQCEVEDELSKM